MLARVREAVRDVPDAAMFALAEQGHDSLFEQLVACVLSIRTLDEVSLPASLALLQRASTPEALARMSPGDIDALIQPVTFHEAKAHQLHAIAVQTRDELGGELPCDAQVLQSFKGVGPKCAHLALGIACGHDVISVDIHVHRVTNRWGYVKTRTPEATLEALEARLPRRSTCPVLKQCRQVGVTNPR